MGVTVIRAGGEAEGDELNDIENVTGSFHNDTIWGNDGANELDGGGGNDTLKGFGGDDSLAGGYGDDWLYGMDGADRLFGGEGNDVLSGGAGDDFMFGREGDNVMIGGTDNDIYVVESLGDTVTELSGEGYDVVYSAVDMTLADNVEVLSLIVGNAVFGTGNALDNGIFGNDNDNVLDGGGGADDLWGFGGNDTFVLRAGQAQGDRIHEFYGNGAGAGDVLRFEGYGTLAQGATFHQLSATQWQITSADGLIQETITLATGAVIDTTTDLIFT
jgi:Ca2+-binding RTX toxin-like protein